MLINFFIDMNSKFPYKTSLPKEERKITNEALAKDKKEANPQSEKSFEEAEAFVIDFLKRKQRLQIEELQTQTTFKIKKLEKERNELDEDAKTLEEKANALIEEAKRKREMMKKIEKKSEELMDTQKNEEKKIEENIKLEIEQKTKRVRESIELINSANKLKKYGIEIKVDIKELAIKEIYP